MSAILPKVALDDKAAEDETEKIFDKVEVGNVVHTDEDQADGVVEANNTFLSDNDFVE